MLTTRRGRLVVIVVSLFAAVWWIVCPRPVVAASWQAGVATVDITPPHLMWMAGYGSRTRPAEGKLADLRAKALVLRIGSGARAALISLDLVGIDRGLAGVICTDLARQYGLRRADVAIACSHTHTGPVVAGMLRPLHYLLLDEHQRALADQYAAFLHKRVVQVVGEAVGRLAPVRLAWSNGLATLAVNRRENAEVKVPELRAQGRLKGPADYDVPVLAVRRPGGKLVAVVFGYACHATVLDFYRWSGDYPGFAQLELEKAHPGCTALFVAGCGADQNPLPRRSVALARQYGSQLATAVDQVLAGVMAPVDDRLACRYREINLRLAPLPGTDQWRRQAQSKNKYIASRARMLLARIAAGRPLSTTYPYPVQTWRFGDSLRMIFLGGEVVVDYALRFKSLPAGRRTWVAAYANDVMAYIPSERVLKEGGYEGGEAMIYYGLPAPWAAGVEDAILRAAQSELTVGGH